MADVKWIKIVTDIFDDEKMLLIENLPDADSVIVIWFKLLCLAGKQNNGGVFMLNDKIAYTDEMLSTVFRRPLNTVRLALKTFETYGMVEIIDNVVTIPNWEKHQNIDALAAVREKTRKRVAAYRERQKVLTEQTDEKQCNVTVRESNAIEEELEGDKELDITTDKEILNKFNILCACARETSIREAVSGFLKKNCAVDFYREQIEALNDEERQDNFEAVVEALLSGAHNDKDLWAISNLDHDVFAKIVGGYSVGMVTDKIKDGAKYVWKAVYNNAKEKEKNKKEFM